MLLVPLQQKKHQEQSGASGAEASRSNQETLLWEKQVPASRVANEQEGLGLWKGI